MAVLKGLGAAMTVVRAGRGSHGQPPGIVVSYTVDGKPVKREDYEMHLLTRIAQSLERIAAASEDGRLGLVEGNDQ